MNNEEKITYLNNLIYKKFESDYVGPKVLFKYRPFDQFTFDMLENEYIYLCPAENEDDETECNTTIDFERIIDLENNNLKRECVNQIIDMLKPYTSSDNFEVIKNKILAITRNNGTVPANWMLDLSLELQKMLPEEANIADLVNLIVNIPKKLDEPEISSQLKPLFLTAFNAKKETGICSFAESNDIDYMWKKYAADSTGYCIEYDISNYDLNCNVLPVIYQDERETNIIMNLVGSFIGQMITGFSYGQINADASQFIRLFLTKNKEWEYQKEWRFIGEAKEKPIAPNIKRIYLGKNISSFNKTRIESYAYLKGIDIKVLD